MAYRGLYLEAGRPAESTHIIHRAADSLRVRTVRLKLRHPEASAKPYLVAEAWNVAQHCKRARPCLVARRVVALQPELQRGIPAREALHARSDGYNNGNMDKRIHKAMCSPSD